MGIPRRGELGSTTQVPADLVQQRCGLLGGHLEAFSMVGGGERMGQQPGALRPAGRLLDVRGKAEVNQADRRRCPLLLVVQGEGGDDDQIVPIGASAMKSSRLVKDATLKVYSGAPHGLFATHKDQFNADLLAFIRA
jgi:pimeloyl-ACP methyl ester carboxylesterase